MAEAALVLPIFLTLALGSVDSLYAFYQYTAAAKAVEVGARLAAVSDPVASGLNSIPTAVLSSSVLTGDAMPAFQVTCDGATSSCTCTSGTCTGMGSYSATAMNTLVSGRGSSACNDATSYYYAGMCDILSQITAAKVKVVYTQTGLGYAGRVSGPVPTITVSLQGLSYQFFFLSALPGIPRTISMPSFSTTITGEGLTSGAVS